MNLSILIFTLIPVAVWGIGITAVTLAVRGNFKRANSRSSYSKPQDNATTGRNTGFSKPQPTVRMSAQRPQIEKGLLDMDVNRRKGTQDREKKRFSFGSFRNTGFDQYEAKGRRKDIVTGYNRQLNESKIRLKRTAGMQYSHTYDGHEPWDKCLPKEKDPWDPDFYA